MKKMSKEKINLKNPQLVAKITVYVGEPEDEEHKNSMALSASAKVSKKFISNRCNEKIEEKYREICQLVEIGINEKIEELTDETFNVEEFLEDFKKFLETRNKNN